MGVRWLNEISKNDILLVGGKGANLGEMLRIEIPVPNGFVIDSLTFIKFLEKANLKEKIKEIIEKLNPDDTEMLRETSQKIRKLIENAKMPKEIEEEIREAYRQLCKEEGEETYVAIRSSATLEDLAEASFAGQHETYLNVKGEDEVVKKVKKCWSSLYTPRAISYRARYGFSGKDVSIAVVVQKMVNSEKSGVLFTSHPVTGEKKSIIEAVFGLGEAIVSGKVTPDTYIYDREQGKIVDVKVSEKKIAIIRKNDRTVEVKLDEKKAKDRVLSDEEIEELVKLGEIIEEHYKMPQDIEWAIEKNKLYIVQSRPITTIKQRAEEKEPEKGKILLKGLGASPGIGTGKVKIILNESEASKINEGDILVTTMTTPDMVPAMKKASAIVTDEGGMTCLAEDTLLLTNVGFLKAREVYERIKNGEDLLVFGFDCANLKPTWKRIIRVMRRKAKIIRVSIGGVEDNYLDITPDHRFYVLNSGNLCKKSLEDILRDKNYCLVVSKLKTASICSNPKLAYVLGLLVSDGYIKLVKGENKLKKKMVAFTQGECEREEIIATFLKFFRDAFEKSNITVKTKVGCGVVQGVVNDYMISNLKVVLQIINVVQNLEKFILSLDEESLIAFVAGLIDGSGCILNGRLQICVSKENILRSAVIALLAMGILPQVTRNGKVLTLQILEDIEVFSKYSVKVKNAKISERKIFGTRFLSAKDLFGSIISKGNWREKIKPYVQNDLLVDKEEIRERILPLINNKEREKLRKLVDSPIQSLEVKFVEELGVGDVYNFEVQAQGEMEKNYVVFTSGLTPILVSNCHAAIVSRELGVPAVVGTKKATKELKDDIVVTVDGEKGIVYAGRLKTKEKPKVEEAKPMVALPITATEVKVNISIPEAAERVAATGADGVGLFRIEHMVLGLKKHPMKYIKDGEIEEYIEELYKGMKKVVKAFYPKPVWIRTLDAPTDEFRGMEGGEDEPIEANPMLGFRGIRRDLLEEEHFRAEIRAMKRLVDEGYTNIGIMLPMVTHPKEVRRAKEIVLEEKLPLDKIDFGVMIETPAAALMIEEIIKEGITFISFGTNDLTQYTLAVDRNNENVAYLYDEFHPAVIKLIENVIKTCKKYNVKTSICGQAGSYPEFVKKLVKMGIDSISANPDAIQLIKETVARVERKLLLEKIRNL